MSDTFLTRPSLGRRLALELRPTRPLTWIGPLAAAATGILSSAALDFSAITLLRVALALLLVDPILSAWRALLVQTDWRAPLRVPGVETPPSANVLPYAQTNSPATRLAQWSHERVAFFTQALWQTVGATLSSLLVLALIALALAMVLGPVAIVLTIIALCLAPLETELGARRGAWARAFAELGIAWLIGFAALALPDARSFAQLVSTLQNNWNAGDMARFVSTLLYISSLRVFLLAILFSLAYRGLLAVHTQTRRRFVWSNLAQLGAALVVVILERPLTAGFVALVVIAQILWQAFARVGAEGLGEYLPRVQWLFLLAMLAVAIAPF